MLLQVSCFHPIFLVPISFENDEHTPTNVHVVFFFFLNDPAPPDTSPLPHPAPLPISPRRQRITALLRRADALRRRRGRDLVAGVRRRLEHPPDSRVTRPPTAASSDAFEHDLAARSRAAYVHDPGPRGAFEAAVLGDLGTYLPHLLNRQDKNTMQHSIETRVPFLDPDVVALALNLPLEARATPERKGVLRDLARVHLPRGVAGRAKLGFGFDVGRYLDGAARPGFLADGRLREVLDVPPPAWRAAAAHLSSAQAL